MKSEIIYHNDNDLKTINIDLLTDKIGPQGLKGYSAYQVAKKNGFQGTQQEWLASLKGEKGQQGNNYVLTAEDKAEIAAIVLQQLLDMQS